MSASPRLCLVGPGHHAPVLGVVTDHVAHALSEHFELTAIEMPVPGDLLDWTLLGLNTPTLVRIPKITEVWSQQRFTRRQRSHRFLLRHRPDIMLLDWWTIDQVPQFMSVATQARKIGAKVVLRCCGRLDTSENALLRRAQVKRLLGLTDLLVLQGWAPSLLANAPVPTMHLPEWKTEERQADPYRVDVVSFVPAGDLGRVELLLQAFGGLSDRRVSEYRLELVIRRGDNLANLHTMMRDHHHSPRLRLVEKQLSDFELEREIQTADIAVVCEPDWSSRALEAAANQGIPVVVMRKPGETGPGDNYPGATMCPYDPASVVAAIERANLARKFRYPDPINWRNGTEKLADRLSDIIGARARSSSS